MQSSSLKVSQISELYVRITRDALFVHVHDFVPLLLYYSNFK